MLGLLRKDVETTVAALQESAVEASKEDAVFVLLFKRNGPQHRGSFHYRRLNHVFRCLRKNYEGTVVATISELGRALDHGIDYSDILSRIHSARDHISHLIDITLTAIPPLQGLLERKYFVSFSMSFIALLSAMFCIRRQFLAQVDSLLSQFHEESSNVPTTCSSPAPLEMSVDDESSHSHSTPPTISIAQDKPSSPLDDIDDIFGGIF